MIGSDGGIVVTQAEHDTLIDNMVGYYYGDDVIDGRSFDGWYESKDVPYLAEFGLRMDTEDMFQIMNHRGEEWTSKVTEYLEKTPYCKVRQWKGEKCFLSFWAVYAQLCDTLVSHTNMPYHIIEAGNNHFEFQLGNAMNYINFEKWLNKRLLYMPQKDATI
ncbi:MAG: hypothetical protein JKY24_02970 [Pseudomonadales bacterium]|nr:hypothetical protein [Pseudomonadales bacterium]